MTHAGQVLRGPGLELTLVSLDPDHLVMEAAYSGEGAMPPAHLHPSQEERFTVLEGSVRTIVDGVERTYGAGESFTVPAGTVHQMAAEGGPARTRWEVLPALRTAELFEDLYERVLTGALDGGAWLRRYEAEFRLA